MHWFRSNSWVIQHGSVWFNPFKPLKNSKCPSYQFPYSTVYAKSSNQKALQFWCVMNSLKTLKTSKGVFWYSSARPSKAWGPQKRETPGIYPVCPMVNPALLLSLVRPTGSMTEGRPMRVNDRLRMEFMAECLGKRPSFLLQERPWSPSLSTNLQQRHSVLSKILAPVRKAIAIQSSSELSRFLMLAIGKASDKAAVWLFCAVSSRQWFLGLGVSSRAEGEPLQARSSQADCVSFCRGDESWSVDQE